MSSTSAGDLVFGRFKVEDLIQEGGQALVWKGSDLETNQAVAIKELTSETSDLRKRFERENSVRLESPFIVQPYQVGEYQGSYFLVMEFIEGQNLKQIIEREGAFESARAGKLLEQIASGLAEAHKNNIIHRDIKPENIMVTPRAEVKITDFGIACFLDKERMTRIGSTLGTAHYMSPEQVEDASKVDASSDIFSLGVVFYEMLTGKKPFDGRMMGELFLAIVSQDPAPLRSLVPTLDPRLESFVLKMLEKSPANRPSGMEEILQGLNGLGLGSPSPRIAAEQGGGEGTVTGKGKKARTGFPCPSCREINPLGTSFCARCGHDMRERCDQCQTRIPPASKFCSRCGAKIDKVVRRAFLIGLKGAFSGERIPIDRDFITIGRHSSNDISFGGGRDDYVSRFHARIFRNKGTYHVEGWDWVKNEATTNGTYVNGKNMDGRGRVGLRDGDRLRIGDSFFRYDALER